MNKIGTDIRLTEGRTPWGDGLDALTATRAAGLEGLRIRTLDELSPTLDAGYLTEFAAAARSFDLYVEMGVGKVNPYMTAELPRVRILGDGDYVAGMRRMIETCNRFDWREAWTAVGGFKFLPGIFFTDRFRTDTDWEDQLRATERLLLQLAPILRDNGVRLNLETHEEITTFELVRLIEAVGDDVLGVCLDPANLLVRAEAPADAIRRVAPYVHSTQLRDAALWRTPDGFARFLAPCGHGVIDWADLLDQILGADPHLNLTIEGIGGVRVEMPLHIHDPRWRAGHPQLTADELARLERIAADYEQLAARGEAETLEQLRAVRPDPDDFDRFVAICAHHLRAQLASRP